MFLTAFRRRGCEVTSPVVKKINNMNNQFLQALLDNTNANFQQAWKSFLFNPEEVRNLTALLGEDPQKFQQVLHAGQQWNGEGCTTGFCSKKLFQTASVTLVSSDFADYRNAFLYSLCLLWSLDVLQLTLADKAAEAAFQLFQLYNLQEDNGQAMAIDSPEIEEEDEEHTFSWEEPEYHLPKELARLWQRSEAGSRRLDLKQVLEMLPRWCELPNKPKANNYRADSSKHHDKAFKVAQQQLLHSLRLQACLFSLDSGARDAPEKEPPEANPDSDRQVLSLQLFQYTADCYFKLEAERKELSLPGSTQREDALFGPEDLKMVRFRSNVNRTFTPSMLQGPQHRDRRSKPPPFRSSGRWVPRWQAKGGQSKGKGAPWRSFKGRGKGMFHSRHGAFKSTLFPQVANEFKPGRPDLSRDLCHFRSQFNNGSSKFASSSGIKPQIGQSSGQRKPHLILRKPRKGSMPSVQGIAEPHIMVEKSRGVQVRSGHHQVWSGTRLARAPFKNSVLVEIPQGNSGGPEHFKRIQTRWSRDRGSLPHLQIFGAMVCHSKDRFKWKRKIELNRRLSTV